MEIRHRELSPSVHPEAYVAPTAVLSGDVRVGPGSCVLHGAPAPTAKPDAAARGVVSLTRVISSCRVWYDSLQVSS